MKGSVYTIEPLGNKTQLVAKINEDLVRFIIPVDTKFQLDEEIYLGLDAENIIYFDQKTQRFLACHNEKELLEV